MAHPPRLPRAPLLPPTLAPLQRLRAPSPPCLRPGPLPLTSCLLSPVLPWPPFPSRPLQRSNVRQRPRPKLKPTKSKPTRTTSLNRFISSPTLTPSTLCNIKRFRSTPSTPCKDPHSCPRRLIGLNGPLAQRFLRRPIWPLLRVVVVL